MKKFLNELAQIVSQYDPKKHGIYLVGSRAYDDIYPTYKASLYNSDYDYIIPIESMKAVRDFVDSYAVDCISEIGERIKDSEYNNGFTFNVREDNTLYKINIIPLIDVEWRAWRWATETLCTWASHDEYMRNALRNRYMRIGLLEQLRATYKTGLAMGSVNNGN